MSVTEVKWIANRQGFSTNPVLINFLNQPGLLTGFTAGCKTSLSQLRPAKLAERDPAVIHYECSILFWYEPSETLNAVSVVSHTSLQHFTLQ